MMVNGQSSGWSIEACLQTGSISLDYNGWSDAVSLSCDKDCGVRSSKLFTLIGAEYTGTMFTLDVNHSLEVYSCNILDVGT